MLSSRVLVRGLLRPTAGAPVALHTKRKNSKIVSSNFPDIQFPDIALHEKVLEDLHRWESHVALVDVVTERKYTYRQLNELSRRVGAGFLQSGLRPGQVISLALPNIPEFLIATLGALRAGLTVSTINPLYGPSEILHQVKDSDTSLVITYPQKVEDVQMALGQLDAQIPPPPVGVIHAPGDDLPPGTRSFLELFNHSDTSVLDEVKVDPDSVAFLLYSSGTTGLPKGVRLTHRSTVSNLCQISSPQINTVLPTTNDYQDVTAAVLPLFHVYGLVIGGFTCLSKGAKVITLPKFDKDLYIKALRDHKTTVAQVVPPIVQFLANHPEVTPDVLSSLRTLMNGAAALSKTDALRLLEKKKDILISSGYGLTEASPVITAPKNDAPDLDSVGYILPNTQIKVISESGEIQDPSEPGEICALGPQIMDGYHKNEEATSKTVINGWLHTGDSGYVKDGRLFIVDRLKELIKVKGFQVPPMELEEVLRAYPGVADVGVVGKPDTRSGEVPVAFVVANKKVTAQELKDYVKSKVAEYKKLSDVIFVDSIPKNPTGKILRRSLKELLPKS